MLTIHALAPMNHGPKRRVDSAVGGRQARLGSGEERRRVAGKPQPGENIGTQGCGGQCRGVAPMPCLSISTDAAVT
ncbi:hypothetical protein E2C01_015410 [Portunus trituberculatus]|uniref:Uncharacterized protein n=1 Tax=Portunus trituberculatus TaxID=210409 RepID=A0A5B7DMP4_PORTR|nr:hypothetical protein [Portunus trituberculatus]